MTFINDKEAFCLANTYGFSPPRKTNPAHERIVNSGKYEPDSRQGEAIRSIVLAHFQDKTNILVQYRPLELDT